MLANGGSLDGQQVLSPAFVQLMTTNHLGAGIQHGDEHVVLAPCDLEASLREDEARGVYSGAIGWFGVDGAMDLSIVIRTLVASPDGLRIGSGGVPCCWGLSSR